MEVVSSPANDSSTEKEHNKRTLEQVRKILLSADQKSINKALQRLDILEHRLNDPIARSKDIDEVIVSVLREQLTVERELRQVLQPVLVEQFHKTARDEPDVMAEALFPILGPAIRKMIANLVSPDKNARQRAHKLEQLLLIDKETGLPLSQVASDTVVSQDADMVSGMLSAIQSFVHDAFSADEFDGLNTLQVGELSVWIEWGPSAVLAAVVRGSPPLSLREAMQIYLEELHNNHTTSLSNYAGDACQFEFLKPSLINLLDNHDGSLKNRFINLSSIQKRVISGSLIALVCIAGWIVYSTVDYRKWQRYISNLESIPGVVVLSHERSFHDYKVVALKDPKVSIPDTLLKDENINSKYVSHKFEAYQALHPNFIISRLKKTMQLPEGISLSLHGSELHVSGNVDYNWLQEIRQKSKSIAGIERVVVSGS